MIVLDTNVLSALMRPEPDPALDSWLDSLPPESVWTTTVTLFEVRYGLELLPAGRRRRRLEDAFVAVITGEIAGRVLMFDEAAALAAGTIAGALHRAGRNVEIRDIQIAGIVAARKATLATRNTRDFKGLGLPLIDPWSA